MKEGSSPLARGLQDEVALRRSDSGIIPARAGFTSMSGSPHAMPRDHPRSRGVYSGNGLKRPVAIWIIPARAGFTSD